MGGERRGKVPHRGRLLLRTGALVAVASLTTAAVAVLALAAPSDPGLTSRPGAFDGLRETIALGPLSPYGLHGVVGAPVARDLAGEGRPDGRPEAQREVPDRQQSALPGPQDPRGTALGATSLSAGGALRGGEAQTAPATDEPDPLSGGSSLAAAAQDVDAMRLDRSAAVVSGGPGTPEELPTPPPAEPSAEPPTPPTVESPAELIVEPTAAATVGSLAGLMVEPTAEPTVDPTSWPTAELTADPTVGPTSSPTAEPTVEPTSSALAEPVAPAAVTPDADAARPAGPAGTSTPPQPGQAPEPHLPTVPAATLPTAISPVPVSPAPVSPVRTPQAVEPEPVGAPAGTVRTGTTTDHAGVPASGGADLSAP